MTKPGVSTLTARIDHLLRSLVGVADVRMVCPAGTLRSVHILRDDRTQPHQLIRNVVSGLRAAFVIELLPSQVHVHDDDELFEAVSIAAEVLVAPEPAAEESGNGNGNGNGSGSGSGNGQGNGNGNGNGARARARARARVGDAEGAEGPEGPEGPEARARRRVGDDVIAAATEIVRTGRERETIDGMALERIDVDRRGPMIRCHTVIALGGRQYSAIAEVPDG